MNATLMKSLFTALFFLIVMLTSAPSSLRSEAPETSSDTSLALSSLAFPEEIGKVQERFTGSGTRTILQIQDVHAHVVAQQNIASILERLRTVFGIKKTALEGAWASTSLPKSHAIPTSREKQLLAATLLDDDRISGPVYAAIMSPSPITLLGMEDAALYEKNRALFLAHLEKASEIVQKLQSYEASLRALQGATWGPELLAFGNSFGEYRETSDLGKFFPVLLGAAKAQGVDSSTLTQIILLQDIMALEKLFQRERLEQEVQHLMREYKNTPWTPEELIRGGKIPPERLGSYPELKNLARLYQLRDLISLRDLTTQIETLTNRVLEKLVRSPSESALWEKTERFYIARRILLLEASPADIEACENEKPLLELELADAGLSAAFSLSLDFYQVVKKRDAIFFEKITNDPSLAGDLAIVTGGFHTDGLSQRFRDAGISYITITPDLGGTSMNEKLYQDRMAEGATLSELRNAIVWIDEKFSESYEALLRTRDVREAKKVFLGDAAATNSSPSAVRQKNSPGSATGAPAAVPAFQLSTFMAQPRLEQLKTVRGWLEQASERRGKAMLVSAVGILSKILSEGNALKLLEEAIGSGDIIALAQDIPVAETPEALSSVRGIQRFDATDTAMLIEKTPRFQRLAQKRPFAIMENGRTAGTYVVLPEKPVSLVLFRIITLSPGLYQAAKDPAFLVLLEDLVAEILSQELSGKAA